MPRTPILVVTLLICLMNLFASSISEARTWKKIKIPYGTCGDGSPYSVSVSEKDPKKVAFFFQGGGACWNYLTCRGPLPLALMWIPDIIPDFSFLSDAPERSPISDYTVVYFPYCTGDVYAGFHIADYAKTLRIPVFHFGAANVEFALHYLLDISKDVDAFGAEKVVVYGVSAGALGAIFSLNSINPYLRPGQDKVAILDSPGLHFDSAFFKRFSEKMLFDLEKAVEGIGLKFDMNDVNFAKHAPEVCARFSDWRVGILQSSRDIIMSTVFGGIWPQTHENLVYGSEGIYQATGSHVPNCSSWVPNSYVHTFLMSDWTSGIEADGVSALQYAKDVIQGTQSGANYGAPQK